MHGMMFHIMISRSKWDTDRKVGPLIEDRRTSTVVTGAASEEIRMGRRVFVFGTD